MDGRARRGCSMRGSPDVHQIVFLIDLKILDINIKSQNCDQIVSLVSRTVLKILTHYAAVVETGQNLRWGFKFCNSCSTSRKSQQDFREFSIKTYESFEQTLQTRVLSDYRDRMCAGETNVRGGRSDSEDTEPGCQGLQRALSEVMSDFQWERPDIRSPVRPQMRRNQHIGPLGLEPSNKNLIYLFSWCPDTPEAFASFFGCDKPCAAESLEALLPRRLLRQFREIHKLALYWIDMKDRMSDVLVLSCSPDLPCVRLMSQMLCSLSGCILPIQAVLHLGLRSDTYIHSTPAQLGVTADTAVANRQSSSLLPFSSVISTYAEPSVIMCQETTANRTTLFLDKDGCDQVLSHLYLYNITKYQGIAPDRKQNIPAECTITIEKGESSPAGSTEVTQLVTAEVDEDTPCFTAPRFPDRLRVVGATQQSAVKVDSLSTKPVYMCATPRECKTTKGWNKLLLRLAQKQLALIVQCHASGYESSIGVLQPLTSVAATLTYIKSEVILNLKTLLSFSSAVCEEKATNDIERFISEPLTHSPTAVDLPPQKHDPPHHFASVAPFHSASLEEFYQQGITSPAVDELSALVHINTDVAMKALTDEEKLMKKYQRRLRTNKSIARRPVTMQHDTSSAVDDQSEQENAPKETATLPRTRSKTLLPSRNDMIIERSRHYQAQVQDKPPKEDATRVCDVTVQEPRSGLQTESADFQDEDELLNHLKESYMAGVDGETLTLTCAQTIIGVTLHYYKAKQVQAPNELVAGLLSKNMFLSNKGIHDKYVGMEGPEALENKLREYEIQILLGLELAVIQEVEGIQMDEEKIEQIVMMLRSLSFLKDASYLADYLKNVLVENYLLTVPKVLGQIYDELLQPMPEALSEVLSPAGGEADSSAVPSVTAAPSVESDLMSFEPPSSRAPRTRRLIHHLSMKPALQKRQIVVDKKKGRNQTRTSARLASTSKITNSAGAGPKAEVRKVRRNLFTGSPRKQPRGKLQRSQTVSVMERTRSPRKPLRKSPRKKVSKISHRSKVAGKSGLNRTPTGKHVLKTKHVTETPAHKQVSSAVLRQLEKKRKHTRVVSSVTVVEESPMKLALSGDNATKKTPRKTIFSSRRSFYSGANQKKSRNVEKYSKLEARMTQQFLQSPPPNGAINHLTPSRKIKPTFLFAKCISPSPRHKRALTFTADADKGIHSDLAGPNPLSSVKKSPSRLLSGLQGPHRKVLDSPSRHTRSQTVEDSPVKHRNILSAGLDVDSPAKNTRGLVLSSPLRQPCNITNAEAKHKSPSSSEPQAELSQILSSPSQNTRSHTSLFSPKESPSVPGNSMNAARTPVKQHLLGNRFNMNKSLHSSPGNSKPRKVTLIKVDRHADPQNDKWKPLFMGSMEEQEICGFSDQSSTVDSRNVYHSNMKVSACNLPFSPGRSNHIAMDSQRIKILESPIQCPRPAAGRREVAKTKAVSAQPQTPCKNQQIRPEFTPPSIKQKHKVLPRKSVSPAEAERKNAYQKTYTSQIEREKHLSPENSSASRCAEPSGDPEQMSSCTSEDQLKRKVCLKRRRRKSSPRNAGGSAGGPIKKQCLNEDVTIEAEVPSEFPPRDGSLECSSQSVSSQEYFNGQELFLSASESTGAGDSLLDKVRSSSVVKSNVVEQPLAVLPAVRVLRKHSSLASHASSLSDCSSTHSPVPCSPTSTGGLRKSDEAHTPSNHGKSRAATNPSPADSVKGLSPGRSKYSPYLSAKGLSALMNSPMLSDHSDESGHSGRLRFSRGTPVLINQSPVTSTRPYTQGPAGDKTAKKSRRSLYRTETSKQIS